MHRKEGSDGNRNLNSRNGAKVIVKFCRNMAHSDQSQTEVDTQGCRSYLSGGVLGKVLGGAGKKQ